MRLEFFAGNELGPPDLLGEIIDLDRPQYVLANVFFNAESGMTVKPIRELSETAQELLLSFAATLEPASIVRTNIREIMSHSSRKKSMC